MDPSPLLILYNQLHSLNVTDEQFYTYPAVEPEPPVAELKVVPKWKKELMARKKGGQRDPPAQPKEPKPAPVSKVDANGEPPWMRELHERKKKGPSAPVKVCISNMLLGLS